MVVDVVLGFDRYDLADAVGSHADAIDAFRDLNGAPIVRYDDELCPFAELR